MKVDINGQVMDVSDEDGQALLKAGAATVAADAPETPDPDGLTPEQAAIVDRASDQEKLLAQEGTGEAAQGRAEMKYLAKLMGPTTDALKELPKAVASSIQPYLDEIRAQTTREVNVRIAAMAGADANGSSNPEQLCGTGVQGLTKHAMGVWFAKQTGLASQEFIDSAPVLQALTEGTGSQGGFLVPDDEAIDIIKAAAHLVQVWPLLDVRTTTSDAVTRPVRSAVGAINSGSAAAAELAAVTATTITYAQQTWAMYSFDAYYPMSLELLNDAPVNIETEVREAAGEMFAEKREYMPLWGRGSGYSEPLGVFKDTGITETSASFGGLTTATFFDFYAAIPQRYRRNATALLATKPYFDLLVDVAKNVYNMNILGLPTFIEVEAIPDDEIIAGDFRTYRVYRNPAMELVTQLIAVNKRFDMVFWERWDGHATITDAFRRASGVTY